MTKLWQRLDAESQTLLCSPEGAEQFLLAFPASLRSQVAQATAQALDSPVDDDMSPHMARALFEVLVAEALNPSGSLPA